MDFVIGLPVSTNGKDKIYNSILVIVNWFTKMVYYKPVKMIINAVSLAEVIIDIVMQPYGLSDLIVLIEAQFSPPSFDLHSVTS